MRLKSLEIKGFKSFGNATTLYFDENVTGVVGPNGSGKSNVVDAFRWVLGEQKSKELRLEQMADVLFNGADKKQQANLAEVSVTFDNTKNILPTEYNTVKITRALYRSGDSEYRINDIVCRLKDIHLLLMDTGIGSNSYSIIELGMVDDILQDKENARRRMFEQAAGISKFKKRKKETLQKLKLTSADLERIEDLLFEIEKNLKDLEKQAKRTKRYFEIKEKYKQASILLYKIKYDRLEEGVLSLNKQVDEHRLEYNQLLAQHADSEAILEEEKRKNLEGERNLSSFQKNLNDLVDNIRRSENDRNLLNQKIQFAEKYISKANEDIKSAKPELENSLKKREALDASLIQYEVAYKEEKISLEKVNKSLEEANSKYQSNKEFQEAKYQNLQILQGRIFVLDKQLAVTNNKVENFQRNRAQKEKSIKQTEEGLSGQRNRLKDLQEQAGILASELEALAEKENNRVQMIESSENQILVHKDKIAKLNRKIDALNNERNLLKSMIENMEGFSESVKFLNKKWNGKKLLLSDILITEDRYRAAVEQVLHPYLSYFIVDNLSEAEQAIEVLVNSQKGKAQFFLLDQVEEMKTTNKERLSPLSSVIETDIKYRKLIDLLCGHVYLAKANDIYNEEYSDIYLIEENGSVFKTPHEVVGGSIGLFEGKKIGRKKRVDLLEKSISRESNLLEKQELVLGNLQSELSKLKSSKFDVQIRLKERQKTNIEKDAILLKSKLDSANQNISALRNDIASIKDQELISSNQVAACKSEKSELEERLKLIEAEASKTDSTLQLLNQNVVEAREKYNSQNIKLIQTENHLINLKKEIDFQEQREKEIKSKIFETEKSRERQEVDLEASNSKLIEIKGLLENLYQKRETEQTELSKAEQDYFKARAKVGDLEDTLRAINKKINDKQFLINQLKDKLNDYKFKKNSIKERIQIEFDYKISDLFEVEIEESMNESELDLSVEKFKRRLDNYGEINPMALEAYDEMQERYVHITEQRDDINKAKVSLMKTITEIEETATQLFLKSFNEVRKHFVTVFRSLFTQDDDCDLVLLDPEDPLNSKIEIIAKPKGKRPKSLSQLSGGEKTLTATALLFSLYLLKPAPFCIFDEVDAPLDDTNIQKFANIIRAFADKSQFIIVTHNKATMAEVDVLYGVFMQKKGISSVSAVDFRTYEEKGTVATTELKTF